MKNCIWGLVQLQQSRPENAHFKVVTTVLVEVRKTAWAL